MFPLNYEDILEKIDQVNPEMYGRTRNFKDGTLSHLSPYISRGIISTRMVLENILKRNLPSYQIEKFILELAWRDYLQQVWVAKRDDIDSEIKQEQAGVEHFEMPTSILDGITGIQAVDEAIIEFYNTGYIHNHMRMYIASICCNIGRSHWKVPAKWMFFHLLDADWGSNALNWQWVAGSNSTKKYYANQANINKYFYSDQLGTLLDTTYENLISMDIPPELKDHKLPVLESILPESDNIVIDPSKPTLLYNMYNLDTQWHIKMDSNRVLLLEPSLFTKYPISNKSIEFMLGLSKNISGIQLFVGEFPAFISRYHPGKIYFKEHPLNHHYRGIKEEREWMFETKGYFPSFSRFWKVCKKEMRSW